MKVNEKYCVYIQEDYILYDDVKWTELCNLVNFINFQTYIWLIPLLLKAIADIILINKYMDSIKTNFQFLYFFILMIMHPFYIVIFGSIAPFTKVQWK